MSLPPRSSRVLGATGPLLVEFDVNCGDGLMPGHTFVVRGLADQGRARNDPTSGDETVLDECQMVDLVYELIPGVTATEGPNDRPELFVVDSTYAADVPLPWSTGGTGPEGSGGPSWFETYAGGSSTVGGLGPWPVPDGAEQLTFWLHAAHDFSCQGALRVDLHSQAASWEPTDVVPPG